MLKNKIVSMCITTNLNGVIGNKEKTIPWGVCSQEIDCLLPYVSGEIVVQGRKTFDGIGGWPVAKRNILLTRNNNYDNKENYTVVDSLKKTASYEGSHLYIIGGAEVYKEALKYVDEVHILIRLEKENNGEIKLPWLKEQNGYSPKEIVMSLYDKLKIKGKWQIVKQSSVKDSCDTKILRYKIFRKKSMKFCTKEYMTKIHEKSISVAKKSKEVGDIIKDCTDLHHQHSEVILGTNTVATVFGFKKNNKSYSVKYVQDTREEPWGNLYFCKLYEPEVFNEQELKKENEFRKTAAIEEISYSVSEYLSQQEFPENYNIMYEPKDYGTVIKFKVDGLSDMSVMSNNYTLNLLMNKNHLVKMNSRTIHF